MSDTPITLRRARPGDRDVLVRYNVALAAESEGLTLDPERLARGVEKLLDDPGRGFYLVAEARSGAAGTPVIAGQLMVTFEWSDWRDGTFWWIQSVYVAPEWRRQGVFAALYREAERLARESGGCGLRLYVDKDNRSAQETYSRLGMRACHYDMYEVDFTRRD